MEPGGPDVLHSLVLLVFVYCVALLGGSNQPHRKNESKSVLALMRETVKENDEPERMPPPPAAKGQQHRSHTPAASLWFL